MTNNFKSNNPRIKWMLLTFVGVGLFAPRLDAADTTNLTQTLSGFTDEFSGQLAAASQKGLLEIAPVHLPIDPPGDCNHYGWPIATLAGDTMIVMHRRIPGHNPRGAGEPDPENVIRDCAA